MAAAALTESVAAGQRQAMMAAEIAMEHHLGSYLRSYWRTGADTLYRKDTMGAIQSHYASPIGLQSTPDFARYP